MFENVLSTNAPIILCIINVQLTELKINDRSIIAASEKSDYT